MFFKASTLFGHHAWQIWSGTTTPPLYTSLLYTSLQTERTLLLADVMIFLFGTLELLYVSVVSVSNGAAEAHTTRTLSRSHSARVQWRLHGEGAYIYRIPQLRPRELLGS